MPRLAGTRVEGLSLGGIETCIDLPEMRLCFDIGRVPDSAVARSMVLFTHAHMDHMGGIAWHCATRALRGLPPPTYVIGRENEAAFGALFEAWRRLDRSDLEYTLIVAGPGDEVPLPGRRVARPFRSVHVVPCQGYAIVEKRQRLRADLRDLPPADIDRLRRAGETIAEMVEIPLVAFCGDTKIEVVEREEVVRKAKLLILECTFLDDRVSVAEARDKGHVHLDEIAARAHLFENEAILLTHFSQRYGPREIVELIDAKLPRELRERVTPFLQRNGTGERGSASARD